MEAANVSLRSDSSFFICWWFLYHSPSLSKQPLHNSQLIVTLCHLWFFSQNEILVVYDVDLIGSSPLGPLRDNKTNYSNKLSGLRIPTGRSQLAMNKIVCYLHSTAIKRISVCDFVFIVAVAFKTFLHCIPLAQSINCQFFCKCIALLLCTSGKCFSP